MATNIAQMGELEGTLLDLDKTTNGILHFFTAFKLAKLLSAFDRIKGKGTDVSTLLLSLIVFRLRNESISMMQRPQKNFLAHIDDNTFYRLMNNPWMDWRRLLMGLAKQFMAHVRARADACTVHCCFVIDDTLVQKTGASIEFISRVFDHVTKLYPLGYKLLLLSYYDGKSLLAADFSLHREQGVKGDYGLSAKELRSQNHKLRDDGSPGLQRAREVDMEKGAAALAMLKRAAKNGMMASYVLMDSWFVSDYMIKGVRSIRKGAMHLLGMCKNDKRKYGAKNKELNAKQLVTRYERTRGKYSRKYRSRYIQMDTDYKGADVRLFLIRYNNSPNWTVLLTTDMKLAFAKAMELYQVRWTIETLFKECKQYLRLGCSQNTDFDGQVADMAISLAAHTILTLQKRFGDYETFGELFRETQQHLLELTLWERLIRAFLKLLTQLTQVFCLDVEDTMRRLAQCGPGAQQIVAILNLLAQPSNNGPITAKNANQAITPI